MRHGGKGARYPLEFKERAIGLGREIGVSHAGQKLGMDSSLLGKWIRGKDLEMTVKKEPKESPEAKAAALAAAREIQKLKRENDELKKANQILKAVAELFSKDPLQFNSGRSLNSPSKKK
jgi:transposase-like protein